SPLKSPVPTIDQAVDTVATYVAVGFKIVVPFISQIATSPAVSRQRMSVLPSPLKSPVPTIVQVLGDTVPTYEVVGFKIVVPFISQIATSPDVSRHRMSPMPSPLKSPVPTIDQAVGTVATYVAVGFKIEVPFISQIATSPDVSCQSKSALPSPLKSRWPTIDQMPGDTVATYEVVGFKIEVPFISQIAVSPEVSRQ